MSKPSMSDEEYKERKNNLLKNSMGDENQFLEYVLFCVVSGRRYTTNNLVTDLSDARLEIKDIIDVYNQSSSSNSVYFDFLKQNVPLTFLEKTLSPLFILYERGITLIGIKSNIRKYKERGYNTSNIGDLIDQIIKGGPSSKPYIPQGVPYTFEEKPREEMVEINPELENFLRENETIIVKNVQVVLPEKIERMIPERFTEHIKDLDIKVFVEQNAIQFSDGTILQFNPQTDQKLFDTVMDYIRLQEAEYPFIIGLVLILEEAGKLETVKGMIGIEKRENELKQKENQLKQKENQLEQKDNQLKQKNQEIELQKKSVVDREQDLQMRENEFQQNVANAQNQQNAAVAKEMQRRDEEIQRLTKQNQDLASAAEDLRKAAIGVMEQKDNERDTIVLEKDEAKKQLAAEKQKTMNMENEIQRMNQIENIKRQFIAKGEEIDIPMDFEVNDIKNKNELIGINVIGCEGDNIKLKSGQMISVDDLIGTPANAAIFRQYAQFFNQLRGSNIPLAVLYLGIITKYNRIEELETQIESILGESNMENPVLGRMEQEGAVPTQQAGEGGDDGTETELSRSIDRFIQQHQNDVPDVILENKYTADKKELEKLITEISVGLKANGFNFNNDQLMYIGKVANIKDIIPGYEYLKQLLEVLYDRKLIPIEVLMLAIIMIERKDLINQFLQRLALRIVQPSSVNINGVNVTRINPNDDRVSEIGKFLTGSGFVIDQERINKGNKSVAIRDVFGNDYEIMRNYVIESYGIRDPADRVLLGIYLFCMDKQYGNIEKLGEFLHQHDML